VTARPFGPGEREARAWVAHIGARLEITLLLAVFALPGFYLWRYDYPTAAALAISALAALLGRLLERAALYPVLRRYARRRFPSKEEDR
jgi:hypothetical protein